MKKNILSLFCIAFLGACNNVPKAPVVPATPTVAETPSAPTVPVPATVAETTCYALRFKKDLAALQLNINGDDVSGLYAIEPNEKDGARGSIKGKKTGNQITGIFLYMIEGSVQSEEVMFKMSGDNLLKATGELVDKGGVSMFKDKAKVKWEQTYVTGDCVQIAKAIDNAKKMVVAIEKLKK
jgi:hypothetical protein